MNLPDIGSLSLNGTASKMQGAPAPTLPPDIAEADTSDRGMAKLKSYAEALPYSIEPNSKMQDMLNLIITRIVQCVEAKDYDPGFLQWESMLTYWTMLKYPMPKQKRIALARIYYHMCTTPGMPTHIVATCADGFRALTRSKKKISIEDLRLPWKPVFKILSKDLYLTRRQFEITQTSWYMGYVADNARRFFHPAAIDEMLATFLPNFNGTNLDSVLATQYYMVTFLPLTHPQSYLPLLFRLWESVNSYMYDDRMLQLLSRLAEMHVDPTVSDPARINEIPDDAKSEDEGRPDWPKTDCYPGGQWSGVYSDVGIFSDHEWNLIMCKCLASMEIPLADGGGSLTTGPSADKEAGFEIGRVPKPAWRIASLAHIIVYSMAPDSMPSPPSNMPTPMATTPFGGSGTATPHINDAFNLGDYLSAPLGRAGRAKYRTYLGGSKALDSLAKLIASTESFFHPTNSGSWTADLSAFIKYIVYDFNKRWHEEQDPACKTPRNRRLTRDMKRELVKSLRTVALLAMFSQESTTVSNIQSCLKSMSVMEPDLILFPILERAIPSLESLVETQRTMAVIKALGAVAPAVVCRDVYYPGAKHLINILELLLPGIDLNDPSKTLCTTAFLVEISQYIMIDDLTAYDGDAVDGMAIDMETPSTKKQLRSRLSEAMPMLDFRTHHENIEPGQERRLTRAEEDALLRDATGAFADWVTSFLRRVIQLFENLPDERGDGTAAGGTTEIQIIDAVAGACSQICVHLSEPLYDLVLNLVYDYATTNVRANAVRAIHQLVECIANANPEKTLARFLPFCSRNIRAELEGGASSIRTTSTASTSLPSDATLHWNLAILRGAMYNDGRAVVKYKEELLSLLSLLHDKTLAKRGFSWSGKLLSSILLTLTHTYPLENRFVNPDEWESEGGPSVQEHRHEDEAGFADFRANHIRYWGKLYKPEEVKISWHVPSAEEIDFALEIFKDLVEPTLDQLYRLLDKDVSRDAIWRNDFCRHLTFVRDAFSGIPTLVKEYISSEEIRHAMETSDILNEIPEMIATVEALECGFPLSDPQDERYQYISTLRRRYGEFLHFASISLLKQGEENTLDAVHMLIRSIRTYMLEYGDNRDSYYIQSDQYNTERSVTRQYAGQKIWPRAVFVRRARLYHSARLRWNSIERRRGLLEDSLIDDVLQWAMWHYAIVRESAQSLLESLSTVYDGLRRRCLPTLYKALDPGTEDDRMKGALWTLTSSIFVKYAVSEPTLANQFISKVFACQHNEKPSVQNRVAALLDGCLNSFVEPCFLIYRIENKALDRALRQLEGILPSHGQNDSLVSRCKDKRVERIRMANKAIEATTDAILKIAASTKTHWKYAIVAIRCLRTLIRRDLPLSPAIAGYFMQKTHDAHPSIRYYAQRALMKVSRYIKLRTYHHDVVDLVLEQNHHPLRRIVKINSPSHAFTQDFLKNFRKPVDRELAMREPLLCDKAATGWLAWGETMDFFLLPPTDGATQQWEPDSAAAIAAIRDIAKDMTYWKKLTGHFSSENHNETISQDHVSCVKSIFQLLGDEPLDAMRPVLEDLIKDSDKNKQRGAAELLAGLFGGSKHWPGKIQQRVWDWFQPRISMIFGQSVKTDTMLIWTSFLEYVFYNKDPRRVQPLVDYLVDEFRLIDYNGESSFDAVKTFCFFRAFYEELNWKFWPWTEDILRQCWPQISSEHDDVRAYIAEYLSFCDRVQWQPRGSMPTAEVVVRESRTAPLEQDVIGSRGYFHREHVSELVKKFKIWREQRLPGVRAFQSTYDRVGVTVCKWLWHLIHDTHAMPVFDYILPLMPELFRFTELHDNDELSSRASILLVRMCGVTPPLSLVNAVLDAIFDAIQNSPSWRVRLKAIPLVQVFYFRQMPVISEIKLVEILEVVCKCLDDDVIEVREMAATTLSGILRLSPRRSILTLKDRFVRSLKAAYLPDRKAPTYNRALRQRHAAILGICALVDSYPYTVERWMPELITSVLAEHNYDPIPISTTVSKCASNFKKTHQDTWHEDSKRFDEEQLASLSTLLTGSSYYA
ncbi:hypothetical protein GLOTRDRAFT_135553 [Gloeophyllum trabeum ATCC 11539]|uniref:ARM repeat-containing protein n=1 Tax=Gloeophyllum trabeum (strain ATCC 11539 / FP-39264 / Madison 617) TaxID=670483 RepID=S7S4W7_GLOTA|nr:uncharacterized protein GLOTRDRAFT_135553 [Gloeophyllum trabeum ATCC 11539]EPQ60969.1 hypothetical protein GLOTRDRAFT_135553 [Gloeophyllum trabeum ATCC 11539]